TVTCPGCGRVIPLPAEEMALPRIQCARCQVHFRPADHVDSPRERPQPAAAPVAQATPRPAPRPPVAEVAVRFQCPTCGAVVSAPAGKVGSKAPCRGCGQRREVPAQPPLRPLPAAKTVLGRPLPPEAPVSGSGPPEPEPDTGLPEPEPDSAGESRASRR